VLSRELNRNLILCPAPLYTQSFNSITCTEAYQQRAPVGNCIHFLLPHPNNTCLSTTPVNFAQANTGSCPIHTLGESIIPVDPLREWARSPVITKATVATMELSCWLWCSVRPVPCGEVSRKMHFPLTTMRRRCKWRRAYLTKHSSATKGIPFRYKQRKKRRVGISPSVGGRTTGSGAVRDSSLRRTRGIEGFQEDISPGPVPCHVWIYKVPRRSTILCKRRSGSTSRPLSS